MKIKNALRKRIVRYLVKHLFNTIDENDVLQIKGKNHWYIRGIRLEMDKMERLRTQAQYFKGSTLWKIMNDELKFQSNLRMFERSKSSDDMVFGKATLYLLEVFNKIIDNIIMG